MKTLALLQDSLRVLWRVKPFWYYGLVVVPRALTNYLEQVMPGSPILLCITLVSLPFIFYALLVAPGALVYQVSQAAREQMPRLPDAWRTSRQKMWRVLGVALLFVIPLVVLYMIQFGFSNRSGAAPLYLLGVLLIGPLTVAPPAFAVCAIIIQDSGILSAARLALAQTVTRYLPALAFYSVYLVLYYLGAVLIAVAAIGFGQAVPVYEWLTAPQNLGLPGLLLARQLWGGLLDVWLQVALIVLYLDGRGD